MWVVSIIIIELGALVKAIFPEQCSSKLRGIVDVPIPREQRSWRKVVHHARVTAFAILIAPIRIVLVIVSNPKTLIRSRALCTTLCGVTPCSKAQTMATHKFLNTEEIRKGIIESAFHIASISPTIGETSTESPPFSVEATIIGVHATQRVVAVGTGKADTLSCGHAAAAEVVIVTTCHGSHTIIIGFEWE